VSPAAVTLCKDRNITALAAFPNLGFEFYVLLNASLQLLRKEVGLLVNLEAKNDY